MQEGISVFISYAHEDQRLRRKLETHLAPLQQQKLIATWQDRKILAGTEWANEIDIHLNTAQIILLLVSAAFLASGYCYGIEMAQALKRHEAGEAHVIPIILRSVDWRIESLSKLQALPTDAEPVTGRGWRNVDEAFTDVARGIRKVIQTLNRRVAEENAVKTQDADSSQSDHQKSSFNLDAFKMVGDVHFQYGHYEDALAAYNQALALDPGNSPLQRAVGDTLFRLSRYTEALAAYGQVLRIDPANVDVYQEMRNMLNKFAQQGYGKGFTYFRDYERRFSILLTGLTGTGKSRLVNTLAGRNVVEEAAGTYGASWLQPCEFDIQGVRCLVIDTPGLRRENEINDAYLAQMLLFVKQRCVDCMLYLRSSMRPATVEELKSIDAITETLGRDIWRRTIIVWPFADLFKSSDEHLEVMSWHLQQLHELFGMSESNNNEDNEQFVNNIPHITTSLEETTPDGQKWLGLLHLAILLVLCRYLQENNGKVFSSE
jgi:tetratricopeptide (TPR) repeat protein